MVSWWPWGPDGKPDFNLLQNFKSAEPHFTYYAFDVLMHKGRDLTQVPLSERRALLRTVLKPSDHVALSEVLDRTAAEMLKFVKSHGLEGVVAKRSHSVYQPGLRTGLWTKHRINLGQEFAKGHFAALRCLIFSNFAQSSTSLSRASFS
jgi:ATP-dependent DNA ligase